MSKAVLEFNIPEELEEYKLAFNGHKYKIACEEMFNLLRRASKYDAFPDWDSDTLEKIREELYKVYREYTVDED